MPSASRRVYLDHGSACPPAPEVVRAMEPYLLHNFASPASLSRAGREARQAVERARRQVADLVGAPPGAKVVFTSSACEANNLALFGYFRKNRRQGNHLIISGVGHLSIQRCARTLAREGFEVSSLKVDEQARISPRDLAGTLTERTLMVSLMVANDQVGTLQPLAEVSGALEDHPGVRLHVDARAAAGMLDLDMQAQGLDLVSLSSNALYGPRGTGALVIRPRLRLEPHLLGTNQEFGLRAGDDDVVGIVGLGAASKLAHQRMDQDVVRLTSLRERLEKGLLSSLRGCAVNGLAAPRLPHLSHLSFDGVEAETLVLELEQRGISAAARSVCLSRTLEPSHVLQAMGLSLERAIGSIQFGLGRDTTAEDIDYLLEQMPEAVAKVRAMV